MNRRNFLKAMGLTGLVGWLGWEVKPKPVSGNPYVNTKMYSTTDYIYSIDSSQLPFLNSIGQGQKFSMRDWPNHKIERVEDTLLPKGVACQSQTN